MSEAKKLKLQYLPVQGRAEGIRLFMLHSGVEFEDAVLEFDVFARAKESGALPYGQVRPIAINRHLDVAHMLSLIHI